MLADLTDTLPDLVDPLIGWRSWNVMLDGGSWRLVSPSYPALWVPRQPLTAVRSVSGISDYSGINAFDSAEQLAAHPSYCAHTLVWGEVALWGEVRIYEKGYRADYAYPAQLFVSSHLGHQAHAIAAELALAYEVPVTVVEPLRPTRSVQMAATDAHGVTQTLALIDEWQLPAQVHLIAAAHQRVRWAGVSAEPIQVSGPVEATGRSLIAARGECDIILRDQAQLFRARSMTDRITSLVCRDRSCAHVQLRGETPVELHDDARATFVGGRRVQVHDRSCAVLTGTEAVVHDDAVIHAHGASQIDAHDRAVVHAHDQSIVFVYSADVAVYLQGQAMVVDCIGQSERPRRWPGVPPIWREYVDEWGQLTLYRPVLPSSVGLLQPDAREQALDHALSHPEQGMWHPAFHLALGERRHPLDPIIAIRAAVEDVDHRHERASTVECRRVAQALGVVDAPVTAPRMGRRWSP